MKLDLSKSLFYIAPNMVLRNGMENKRKKRRRAGERQSGRQARWMNGYMDRLMGTC